MQQLPGKPLAGADSSAAPSTPSKNVNRRRFLFSLSAGTAGAAAAIAAPVVANVAPTVAEPARESAGYQESEHVRHYYRTARL